MMLASGTPAYALPKNGTVASGTAIISNGQTSATINQSSQSAIVNWQSFSIAQGETVTFQQPNSDAVTLNRVQGSDPSNILGSMTAKGKVFLVNPNGVLFGKSAQANVGGLVASTLDITDANFKAQKYKFSGSSTNAVLNQGTITADGGSVALLGAQVANDGVINARLGSVALAAGSAMTLDVSGDGLLNVTVDAGAVNALARNGGLIKADGGQVVLTAQSAGQLLRTVVNNTGVIEAQSIGGHNGTISLLGDVVAGGVEVSGRLDASGTRAGQSGGDVVVTGNQVALSAHAKVDVSGITGGGTAKIGGDYQGKGRVAHAKSVTMGKDVVITANAVSKGNGGKVVLWSEGETQALGTITAQGGARSGNGGSVETSGEHVTTAATTSVNTLARHGATGLWLLDPVNYVIALDGGDETPLSVETSLALANRLITATNDISVNDPVTWSTPQTLTLNAGHDVLINAAITASTAGAEINLIARHDVAIGSALNTDVVLTASGIGNKILLTSGNDINIFGTLTASAGATLVELDGGHDVNLNAATITTSGGGAQTVIRADQAGIPGPAGGTVRLIGATTVTSTVTPTIYYSPENGYNAPNAYPGFTAFELVFVAADDKVYDGLTTATAALFAQPPGVELTGGTIAFADKNVGVAKQVNFANYAIAGTDAGLYSLFAATGTTTAAVTPAPLTITANNLSKVYGTTPALSSTAFTSLGLKNDETIATVTETSPGTLATASVAGSNYAITASNAVGGSYIATNYVTTYAPGALTVTPAPLLVTANDAAKGYGTAIAFAPAAFTSQGLQNGDTIAGVSETSPGTAATAPVAGGPYAITAANAVGGSYVASNYVTTYAPGRLVVSPALLSVTANDASKPDGQAIIFDPTAFTASGLQNGDTIAGVSETSPGAAAAASGAGSPYVITASDAVGGSYIASNYTTTYTSGVLTVLPTSTSPGGGTGTGPGTGGGTGIGPGAGGGTGTGTGTGSDTGTGTGTGLGTGTGTGRGSAQAPDITLPILASLSPASAAVTTAALPSGAPQVLILAVVGSGVNMPVSQPLLSVRPVSAVDAGPAVVPVALPDLPRHEYPRKPDRN